MIHAVVGTRIFVSCHDRQGNDSLSFSSLKVLLPVKTIISRKLPVYVEETLSYWECL